MEAVTVVAGNVPFDRQVEDAKYTLSLLQRTDVPVYEGATEPLLKDFRHAEEVHGEGGLGGDFFPETSVPSAEGFGPAEIVRRCRAEPKANTLLCIGPLTNIALALSREPELPALVNEVWIMGRAAYCRGNMTAAAGYNIWVDPEAAKRVFEAFEVTLVDWGLSLRASLLSPRQVEAVQGMSDPLPRFIGRIIETVYEFTRKEQGIAGVPQPDSLTAALLAYPELRGEIRSYPADIDEREGLTRGYLSVDTDRAGGESAGTRVVESADGETFSQVVLSMLRNRAPDSALTET